MKPPSTAAVLAVAAVAVASRTARALGASPSPPAPAGKARTASHSSDDPAPTVLRMSASSVIRSFSSRVSRLGRGCIPGLVRPNRGRGLSAAKTPDAPDSPGQCRAVRRKDGAGPVSCSPLFSLAATELPRRANVIFRGSTAERTAARRRSVSDLRTPSNDARHEGEVNLVVEQELEESVQRGVGRCVLVLLIARVLVPPKLAPTGCGWGCSCPLNKAKVKVAVAMPLEFTLTVCGGRLPSVKVTWPEVTGTPPEVTWAVMVSIWVNSVYFSATPVMVIVVGDGVGVGGGVGVATPRAHSSAPWLPSLAEKNRVPFTFVR